ncbi:MAG TPA: hypothetical protein VG962_15250 [Steroidobacteraceae bacterium]|nr:hypothetical protein [Steroidobacteraceae bacterium]
MINEYQNEYCQRTKAASFTTIGDSEGDKSRLLLSMNGNFDTIGVLSHHSNEAAINTIDHRGRDHEMQIEPDDIDAGADVARHLSGTGQRASAG